LLETVPNRNDRSLKTTPVRKRTKTKNCPAIRTTIPPNQDPLDQLGKIGEYEPMTPDSPPTTGTAIRPRPGILSPEKRYLLDVDVYKQYQEETPAGTISLCMEGAGSLSRGSPLHLSTGYSPNSI
jgi:hypothetical protein